MDVFRSHQLRWDLHAIVKDFPKMEQKLKRGHQHRKTKNYSSHATITRHLKAAQCRCQIGNLHNSVSLPESVRYVIFLCYCLLRLVNIVTLPTPNVSGIVSTSLTTPSLNIKVLCTKKKLVSMYSTLHSGFRAFSMDPDLEYISRRAWPTSASDSYPLSIVCVCMRLPSPSAPTSAHAFNSATKVNGIDSYLFCNHLGIKVKSLLPILTMHISQNHGIPGAHTWCLHLVKNTICILHAPTC